MVSESGTFCFAGTWCPDGIPRSDVRGVPIELAVVPLVAAVLDPYCLVELANLTFVVLGIRVLPAVYVGLVCGVLRVVLFVFCTVALYASLSNSSRSRRSMALTHSTTVEVEIERSL